MASTPRKAKRASKTAPKAQGKAPVGGWSGLWARNLSKAQKAQEVARKAGKKNLATLWKKNLAKARKEQAKARDKKGLRSKSAVLKRVVRTTRATGANVAIRDRLSNIEDIFQKVLDDPKSTPAQKEQAAQGIRDLEIERQKQRTDPKMSVPVGLVDGGAVIGIDEYRGGVNSFVVRGRAIYSGTQLLGTMEGWQHVVTVISAEPFGGPMPKDWKPQEIPSEVMDRIRDLPQLNGIPDADKEEWILRIAYLWAICEDRGALVIFELDYPDTQKKT